MRKQLLLLALMLFSVGAFAQDRQVSGTVTDQDGGGPLAGVNVRLKGTNLGTATDGDGKFAISVPQSATTLVFSFVGYADQEVSIANVTTVSVALVPSASELGEIVVTVGRGQQRTITDTPMPIDVLSSKDLSTTGQVTFDKALQYRVPSFNTVQTPVNDATSLLDPYELRNMGPSRTLILINGKRKNASALIYTQTSPGRGETGADISAIPQSAIERVEILRDGASAQYGSDAIAGVMNIILKNKVNDGSVTFRTGITGEGDGGMLGIAVNDGTKLLGKGFINYTIDFSKVQLASRSGKVSAGGELMDFGGVDPSSYASYTTSDVINDVPVTYLGATDITNFTPAQIATEFTTYQGTGAYTAANAAIIAGNTALSNSINSFLDDRPDAGNINGAPETTASKFLINGGFEFSETTSLYFNAAYIYKKVNSYANYRTPYWRTLGDYPYLADFFGDGTPASYKGYVPTFDGDLNDYNGTVGIKSSKNGWNTDVSLTVGGNRQTYTVRNSHNRNTAGLRNPDTYLGDLNGDGIVNTDPSDVDGDTFIEAGEGVELIQGSYKYRETSPVTFRAGGTQFNHIVGNIDITKSLADKVTMSLGSEFRSETFKIIEGDVASYEGGGADSFAGNSAENSFSSNRYNIGGYLGFGFDISENFLLDATGRYENYSDFGDAFVYKLSTRYKLAGDKVTLRSSFSTGFRAPSLHQIYTQKAQYSFVPGQGIQVSGLVNNVSREANLLGIPKLDAEKSTNFTIGLGAKPSDNLSFTLDYYSISVKDRIVLSTEIGPSGDPSKKLDQILTANGIGSMSFFTNSMDTKTSGIDFVGSYRNFTLGAGSMTFNLAGNYTLENKRVGNVNNAEIIADAGQSVLNETTEALTFSSRPKFKGIFGIDYAINKFTFSLNNTAFGPTKFRNAGMSSDLQVEFETRVVSDLGITFQANEKTTIVFNVNNLLNVIPKWKFVALNSSGESLMNDNSTNYAGLTPIQVQSNLITFNQRYDIVTYDGSHFSQLGRLFNLTVNVKF